MTTFRRRVRLTIAGKFFAVVLGMTPLIVAVAFVGYDALKTLNDDTTRVFDDNIRLAVAANDLSVDIGRVEAAELQIPLRNVARRRELEVRLDRDLIPEVSADLAEFDRLHAGDPVSERKSIGDAIRRWRGYVAARDAARTQPPRRPGAAREMRANTFLDPLVAWASRQAAFEQKEAGLIKTRADRVFRRGRRLIFVIAALALALATLGAVALIRNVVPRLREYARFAERVGVGDLSTRVDPRGSDELTALGRLLNDMVERRERDASALATQAEFLEVLQYSTTEEDAHALIRRHLGRVIPGAEAVVLRRNNSADRLEATTAVDDPELAGRLDGAKPSSCMAVRFSRTHRQTRSGVPLLTCDICGETNGEATCHPLLVAGEVIGSVLLEHERPLTAEEDRAFSQSVTEAAPVLANLRTLAIAELRAATDELTGLPNDRSVRDTIKRMVAQASRTASPLAAVAVDLDHFKQINDTYGHGIGDEVLAAVGATLAGTVRESDFAGRFGGEEFLLLLPNTSADGARLLAEKVRGAIGKISIAAVERPISASLGVAVLPDHAATSDALLRSADRALYVAKRSGRDRVELASGSDGAGRVTQPP